MSRAATMAGFAALACAALAAGYFFARETTAPAEPSPPPVARPEVPETRPDFSLADSAGVTRSIAEWDGQALMINFWATWCPPCRREIPLLNSLRAQYAPRGFEVIGIAVDFRDDVVNYMATTPIDYPVLIGEQDGLDVAKSFGMETMGFPFTVFTDRAGRIVTVHVGELHEAQAGVILSAVEAADAGEVDLDTARSRIRDGLAALQDRPSEKK